MSGYSKTPLHKKIGYKEGCVVLWINPPSSYSQSILENFTKDIKLKKNFAVNTFDLIHIFSKSKDELEKFLKKARSSIKQDGMIWLSWPKKASKVPTDLDGNIIRNIGLGFELVDIKISAIDEIWSGLKFVIPKEKRL